MDGLAVTGLVMPAPATARGEARLDTDRPPVSARIVSAQEERAIARAAFAPLA